MKPHPRIRKTIKWGGFILAFVCLIGWVLSLDSRLLWTSKSGMWLATGGGSISAGHVQPAPPEFDPAFAWSPGKRSRNAWWMYTGSAKFAADISVDFLYLAAAALLATAVAWVLDARASHRAGVNDCPNCNYNRTGLAAGAKCPECGSGGLPA